MKILFDVGANHGTDSLPIIARHLDWICFAFEPTPRLIHHLQTQSRTFSDRYHVIPCAVSDFDGESEFNIAGQTDWGCSSLLKFSNNLDKTWSGRTDFKVTETITVKVITLKTFIEQMSPIAIDRIDHFHCDTQGSDLKVLKGMGHHIGLITKGVVEAANKDNILYDNQNSSKETNEYLIEKGFKTRIEMNDGFNNEVNIFFEQ